MSLPLEDPKEHKPSTKANFAHIDFRDRTLINRDFPQVAVDNMWEQSKVRRLRLAGRSGGQTSQGEGNLCGSNGFGYENGMSVMSNRALVIGSMPTPMATS